MAEHQSFFNAHKPKSTEGIFDHVLRALPENKQGIALDLCCGTGQLTSALGERGYQAYGFDISDTFIGTNSNHAHGFAVTDVNAIPLAAHQASLITFIDSLQYFEKPEMVITEAARLLKPDGYLLMSCQNNYNSAGIKKWIMERITGKIWSPWLAHPVENFLTYPQIIKMLQENGFEIEYQRGKQLLTPIASLFPAGIRNWTPWRDKPWRSLGQIAGRTHFPAYVEEGFLRRFGMIIFIKARKV
jgi:2-polyprenyl-3-methyl-5-hydroxy-6-metoxy-1,4-benzoquinol methylase